MKQKSFQIFIFSYRFIYFYFVKSMQFAKFSALSFHALKEPKQ